MFRAGARSRPCDGGRQSVEVAGAECIGGASTRNGVGVIGADDRGVCGHVAIILLTGFFARPSIDAEFRRARWSRRCLDQETLVGVWTIERSERRRSDACAAYASQRSCATVVSVSSLRNVAAWAALVGGGLWLAQGVVLIARGGAEPDPRIEAVTFSCGFVALVAAAGIASWVSSAAKSRAARAALAVLAALSVPLAVFLGQAAAFALPGSHWLESDVIVLVIALVAIFCGLSWLRRRAHLG